MSKKNLIQRIFGRDDGAEERTFIPGGTFTPMSAIFGDIGGRSVANANALKLSAVYACVSKISDTIASMDINVERRGPDGLSKRLSGHPAELLMNVEPNRHMGAYEFWQMVVSDALLYGKGYAVIMPSGNEMYWVPAGEVSYKVDQQTGEKMFTYAGAPGPVPQERMLEIKAFRGLSPTQTHESTLNTTGSVQEFGRTFFANGGMLGGLLTSKEYLPPDKVREAAAMWRREYMGSENAHKIAILGGGWTYQPLSVPLDQLQWLDVKKYSAEEIARIYQVPPSMVGLDTQTAYSNYEQQVLQFNQGTIIPWVRRIEMEVERKLLSGDVNLTCRFNTEGLLRGDLSTRASYYHQLLSDGVLSIDEVRAKEGLPPTEGGDVHLVALNQIPLGSVSDYADSIVRGSDSPTSSSVGGDDNEPNPEGVDNQSKQDNG